jgi:hypothetical protein
MHNAVSSEDDPSCGIVHGYVGVGVLRDHDDQGLQHVVEVDISGGGIGSSPPWCPRVATRLLGAGTLSRQ